MIYTPRSAHVIPVQRPLRRRLFRALNIFVQLTVILSLGFQGGFGLAVPAAKAVTAPTVDILATEPAIEPSSGIPGDKDGEPPTSSNADPSELILAARIVVPAATTLTNVVATLADSNGDSADDLSIDDDNPRGLGTLSTGTHWVYWSLEKDQSVALKDNVEHFSLSVTYDGGSASSPVFVSTMTNAASISQNDMDFVESFVSPSAGTIGSTFDLLTKYEQSSANALSQIISQSYYPGTVLRLTDTDAYYYNDADPGTVSGGVPAGFAAEFNNNPHITSIPGTSDNNDFWVFKYHFEIIGFGNGVLAPYLQTLGQGSTWKVDSGYGSFEAAPSKISGFKFDDLNGDGDWDQNEPPLSGVTINLSGDASATTTTSGAGFYEFANLSPGSYTVSEVVPAGYTNTTPVSVNLTLAGGDQQQVNFGNRLNEGTITFEKIVNGGSADPSDWDFTIDEVPGTFNDGDSVTLQIGTYTVTESGPTGYASASAGGICSNLNGNSATLTVTAQGGTCTFTNDAQPGTLTVIKEVINDNGGTADASDFTIHVSNGTPGTFSGDANGTAVTVAAGDAYSVTEDPAFGYTTSFSADCSGTMPEGGSKTCTVTNNDIQPKLTVTKVVVNDNGGTAVISDFPLFVGATGVTSGVQNGFNAATYVVSETPQSGYTATISGDCDANGNVTLNAGDVKSCTITNDDQAASLTVIKHVVNVGGSDAVASDFTLNVDGPNASPATFAGDESGTVVTLHAGDYVVSEDPAEGWTTTFDEGCEGTLPPGGSATCTVTNSRDAGRIEGTKFDDQNGDGVWDDGEPGVPGVTIHLSNGDETDTDEDGNYAFDPVPTGTYAVSEDVPAGWTATTPDTVTGVVVENDGEAVVNFGNFQNVSVTACKVEDADGNIETTNDQTAVSGWTVHLSVNGETEDTRATGEDGCYTWTNLGPGVSYDVSEDVPEGWTALGPTSNDFGPAVSGAEYAHTFANFQNGSISGRKFDDVDQNGVWDEGEPTIAGWTIFLSNDEGSVSTATGQDGTYAFSNVGPGSYTVYEEIQVGWVQTYPDFTTYTFDPLLSGTESADNDFGNFHLGRISGFKFNDLDGDGTWDEGESGLDGWTICLNGIENCVVTGTGDWPDGYYEFTGLTAGSYDVYESQQDGWVPTTPTEIEGIVVQSGTDSADNNFGNFRTIELSGQKFNDRDQNGVKDEGDTGLSGWTIQLWEWNGEGFDLVGTQITDGSGNYAFTNLGPGTYRLREVPQGGWTQTTADPADVVAASGTNVLGLDFGNFRYGRIEGFKFDNSEHGLPGWVICLDGPEEFQACTETDQTGHYAFDGLAFGTYTVTEQLQDGWTNVSPDLSGYTVGVQSGTGQEEESNFYNFVNRRIFPDLSVTKTDGLTIATAGQTTTYSITIHNGGEYQAEHVSAVDTLPAHTSFVSASDSGTFSAGQVTWADLGTLAVGADKVVTVTVALDALFPFGTTNLHNVVTVATTTEEPNTDNNGAFDDTSVSASPVLGLTKTADPTAVPAGTNVNWTVHWSVSGDSLATAVVITDPIPANSTFVSVADGGTYDAIPNTLTWNLGTKNPGDSGDVHFVTRVASPLANGTVIHNVASIDSTETDPAITAFADAVVISAPTLTIQKTDSPDPVAAGANLTYTLQWSVGGNAPATNVVITDPLPANTTFVSADNGGSYNAGTNTVTWNLGNKNLPEVGTVSFIVKVANPLPNGTVLTNTATIDSDETPPVSSTTTTTVASAPVLTIAKVNNGSPFVNPGAVVTYTVTVSNTAAATDTAHTVKFTDVLPSGFTYVNSGGSTQTFTLGELAPGASVATSYQATVSSNQTAGLHTNTATASADNHPAISATSVVDVRVPQVLGVTALPTLEISKTADVPFAGPDTTVNYTVTVKNVGDATAVNVVLHDTLPKGFTFTSGGRDKDWNLGNLEPGTARVINYPVHVSPTVKAGKYTNVATAQADNADQVSAKHTLPVKVARVLGLATTGPSALDYVLLTAGALLLLFGALGLRRKREERV